MRSRVIEGLAIGLLATLLRLLYLAPYPTGWDDVDFALALQQYDLTRMQPHFPGYPIYILLAHGFYGWLHDPFLSLSLLSVVAGGLTVVPLWLLFIQMGSVGKARIAVLLYAISPLPLVSSIQPMSDALGAFFAAWLAYFAWQAGQMGVAERLASFRSAGGRQQVAYLLAAGVVLGLLLGIRISYLALSALWLWAIFQTWNQRGLALPVRMSRAFGSVAMVTVVSFAWFTAQVITVGGLGSFLSLAVSFTGGHFTDWGGVYQADASLIERAHVFFFRQIGAAGLGTVWTDAGGWRWLPTLLVVAGIFGVLIGRDKTHRQSPRILLFLLVWIVPYLLWAFFAQNVEKPRHILPLLPPLIYLLVSGTAQVAQWMTRQQWGFATLAAIWLLGTANVSYPLLTEAHRTESPMMQLARYVKAHVAASNSLIFTWEEQRVLQYYTPAQTVIRLRKWEDFRTEVLQYEQPPARILATNALLDGFQRPLAGWFREIATFRGNPWLYPAYHTIQLFEAMPGLYDQLQKGKGETSWKFKPY